MEYFRQKFDDYLRETWPVQISEFSFESAEVFRRMAPSDYEATFTEWVEDEKEFARERVHEFLRETDCLDRFRMLASRIRSDSVVPFVGAGMSIPSGMQPWGEFVLSLLTDAPHAKAEVAKLILEADYEGAAQVAHDQLGSSVFAEEISNRLGNREIEVKGAVRLLPQVFRGEVLTTNFDFVLTQTYETCGTQFRAEISGSSLREAPGRLGMDRHCLLRLHGVATSTNGRVLTAAEYLATYSQDRGLAAVLAQIAGARSFLFLGCSLHTDRTLTALADTKTASPVPLAPHYAFLALKEGDDRYARRLALDKAGIHPIYYPDGNHDQCIEDLLICLADEVDNA